MKKYINRIGEKADQCIGFLKERSKLVRNANALLEQLLSGIMCHIYLIEEVPKAVKDFKIKIFGQLSSVIIIWILIVCITGDWKTFILGAAGCIALIIFLSVKELKNQVQLRQQSIRRVLPDFITRMVLLLEAGMTVNRAFELSGKKIPSTSHLYKEVKNCCTEINGGTGEQESYEMLARNCRVIEVSRFSSVLVQNLRKGNSQISSLLRLIAAECWDARRVQAKGKGEEMSVKLLLPMTVLLIAIMLLTIGPAVMTLFKVDI